MENMKIGLFLLCFFCSVLAHAQIESSFDISEQDSTVTDYVYTNVNVFKDARLDVLKDRPALVMRNKLREELLEKRKEQLGVTNVKNSSAINRGKRVVTGSIVTKKGFRVVIYNGSSRAEAMESKRDFMRSYPSVRSYMSYIAPSYKIRVGDFESRSSANNFLRTVQKGGFPKSFIVPDIVTIKDINVH